MKERTLGQMLGMNLPDPIDTVKLDGELELYLEPDAKPFPMLRHPLVYSIPYSSTMNHLYNQQLAHKRELLAVYKQDKNWAGVIWLHERPYRLNALMNYKESMHGHQYWELVGAIYTDTENAMQNREAWDYLFRSEEPERQCMMTSEEIEVWGSLPPKVKIYRGAKASDFTGHSWTLSYEIAKWFADRNDHFHGGKHIVQEAEVDKACVVAYFNRRSEEEIIVLPETIRRA